MSVPVAFDMVRMFSGPLFPTPRGIDRVDLGYARHFAELWCGDCGGTLPTPWGVLWFDRGRLLKLIERLEDIWSESIETQDDAGLDEIKLRLSSNNRLPAKRRRKSGAHDTARRFANLFSAGGFSRGLRRISTAPQNSIYVNIGHVGLAFPWFLSWLQRRPDVKPVFMLHDMIPLENPEWVSDAGMHHHRHMTNNAARYAAALIATSPTARDSVMRELRLRGRGDIPVATVPLPVAPIFLERNEPDEELASHDYFVVCGSLEPRKNHALLINVWRELVRRHGPRAPKLVVVGSPGWGGDAILHLLTRSREIENHVILARGLSSPALQRLMSHAKGVLMASYAEGYGLPLIEALCVGTPVVASDLPAHRDVAGDYAIYRHPMDGLGWLAAVETLADNTDEAQEIRRRIVSYRPPTWPDYYSKVEGFLRTLS
ncbi:MAG TPA: glycosyltransferase family 1 protein [Methylocella sp.]|nr:glycosyltransferase family 1 protein [Methylocella sp.]